MRRLAPVAISRALQPGWDALPLEELWLVGHRALRTVPRIAALWDFLAEQMANGSAPASSRSRRRRCGRRYWGFAV